MMKNKKLCFLSILVTFLFGQFVSAQTSYNKLDEKGNKHGLWKGFYDVSRRLKYEGNFEHGVEAGLFTFYDNVEEKRVIATRDFNINDHSAYTIFYDQNKNIVSEGKVVNKLFEGPWKYYHHASKIIMTLENYKSGKLEGLRSVYYRDGSIAEETNYKNNIKEGFYKKYSEAGVVLEATIYKNGLFHGATTYTDPQGNMVSKGVYTNGKKTGIWEFFANGKKISQDNFDKPRKKFKKRTSIPKNPY